MPEKPTLNPEFTADYVQQMWKKWFIKGMKDYVRVPNTTPRTDPEYC